MFLIRNANRRPKLRNLVWATSKHDVYLMPNYSIMHWSSLSQSLTEILNFYRHVAGTGVFVNKMRLMVVFFTSTSSIRSTTLWKSNQHIFYTSKPRKSRTKCSSQLIKTLVLLLLSVKVYAERKQNSSSKQEETSGGTHEISAQEKLLIEQPELLQQSGDDFSPSALPPKTRKRHQISISVPYSHSKSNKKKRIIEICLSITTPDLETTEDKTAYNRNKYKKKHVDQKHSVKGRRRSSVERRQSIVYCCKEWKYYHEQWIRDVVLNDNKKTIPKDKKTTKPQKKKKKITTMNN
ncbi:unnamed protein product [Lactuca saligna]|uniref:Uncharacterized protein n=1 Tax=Lactuca saligna TaxID=75948 RepID=A0AA36EL09_LACSI|nr:unnamed protein product [Lactuca saligna]